MMSRYLIGAAVLQVLACAAPCEAAFTKPIKVLVKAKADIYKAGRGDSARGVFGAGLMPPSVALPAGTQCVFFEKVIGTYDCASKERCITIDDHESEGTFYNDADGVGAYPPDSSTTGKRSISGIKAPHAGYLVGLFVPAGGPSGARPATLDFTKGEGTSFTHLAPALDQTFFVGDGQTGDDSGTMQTFSVPATATTLYLGISDAGGFNGRPGAYFDNVGLLRVTMKVSQNACPG